MISCADQNSIFGILAFFAFMAICGVLVILIHWREIFTKEK